MTVMPLDLSPPLTGKDVKNYYLRKGDCEKVLASYPDGMFDLVVTSPPYNIGKEYEKDQRMSLAEYVNWLDRVIEQVCAKVSDTGSICWQVGSYIENGEVFPLDIYLFDLFKKRGMKLRNRIIWQINFGLHASNRFSGRYETLMWFSKSDEYTFNVDPVRVPQLYPGKRHASGKGAKAGQPSGNPKGKNPGDYWTFEPKKAFLDDPVWDMPNVKSNHPEKTIHPCQFPLELVERCVLALSNDGDKILDPFVGTGTSVIAALKHNRIGYGIDKSQQYVTLSRKRIKAFQKGTLKMRPSGKPVRRPKLGEKVSTIPEEWKAD